MLAGRAKGMMAERLAVSEAKLMKLHHDEVIKNLVEIKMELAQSRFEALELQVSARSSVHTTALHLCSSQGENLTSLGLTTSWFSSIHATCPYQHDSVMIFGWYVSLAGVLASYTWHWAAQSVHTEIHTVTCTASCCVSQHLRAQ